MSFKDRGCPLNVSHVAVRNSLSAKDELLLLKEPDGTISSVYYINDITMVELPEDMKKNRADIILKAASLHETTVIDGALCIPLHLDQTSDFAVLIFKDCNATPNEDTLKAVSAFAAFLYYDGMGGILKSPNEALINVNDLEVTYDNGSIKSKVIKGISFCINKGELCVLQGASGCGKTTTLNAISGMLTPSGGSIMFRGKDIAGMNKKELATYRRDSVGFVFQHYNLIGDLTIAENVELASGLSESPMDTMEALSLVGMENEANKYPSQLSGGQQQRACIARAIAKRSELLICDEPTGALDTENSSIVVRILRDLAVKQGIAVVMITHNPAFALIAHHCIVMSDGKIAPKDDIFQPFPLEASRLSL